MCWLPSNSPEGYNTERVKWKELYSIKNPTNLLVTCPARGWQCPACLARDVNTAAFLCIGLDIIKCLLSPATACALRRQELHCWVVRWPRGHPSEREHQITAGRVILGGSFVLLLVHLRHHPWELEFLLENEWKHLPEMLCCYPNKILFFAKSWWNPHIPLERF